jgi:hypothetical protein
MRPLKGHPIVVVNGTRKRDWQDAEKVDLLTRPTLARDFTHSP